MKGNMTEYTVLTSADITFVAGSHRYHITDTKPKVYIPSVTTVCGLLDKPFLIQWAANVASKAAVDAAIAHKGKLTEGVVEGFVNAGRKAHRDVREEGGNVGTVVHNHVRSTLDPTWEIPEDEKDLDGGLEAEMSILAFDEWHAEHIVRLGKKVLLTEQIAVHPTGLYVGTLDLLLLVPDPLSPTGHVLELVDWKTSNQSDSNPSALYPEYLFQIAAYRRLLMLSPEFDNVLGSHPFGDAQQVSLGKNGRLVVTSLPSDDLEEYADAFETLCKILATYRAAQGFIRKANSDLKDRLANEAFETHASGATS